MAEGSFLERIFRRRKSNLTIAAQQEAATRPVIGGTGPDAGRQAKLNEELGMDPKVRKAREDLAAGKINLEQFDEKTGRK